jgi:predicted ferric reductase
MAKRYRWQSHPFSMSCLPDGRHLRVTIKHVGDFTRQIPGLKPGTPVIIDGPHGVFTARQCHSARAVMIAGGIGITPIRSLSEELLNSGRHVHIIYSNRNQASIVFRKELDELASAFPGRLKLTHVISEEPSWDGEYGRLYQDKIARLVPETSDCDFYLCGPPSMMMSMRSILLKQKVRSGKIHYERFSL